MLIDKDEQQALHELLLENQRLMTENNLLLRKMQRRSVWSFWMSMVWYFIILGAPFILYYYVIEPYFTSFALSLQGFGEGLENIPGWKQLNSVIGGGGE